MRNMFALILLAMLPSLGAYAGEAGESVRYITLTGGRVYAIAEEHIKGENRSDNVVTLSLEGGEEWSYSVSDVVSDDNQYEGTTAELLSFGFTHEDNDQVYKDVEATITEEGGAIVVKADVPVIGKRLRPSFTTSEASGLYLDGKRIVSGKDHFRFTSPIEFTLAQDNHYIYEVDDAGNGEFVPLGKPCRVEVKYLTDYATGRYKIPTVYITFGEDTTRWDESQWIGMKLPDGTNTKEEWIEDCTFQLDGAGVWPDIAKVEGCEVRGRGNSSWSWSHNSKNPFRIKLPKKNKQSPFNLTEDRQWVFIANKQNGSMTSNSIAQKIAAMVDGEALCHMIPVDVYINGNYRGSYCFTEKIGIADNSVAIDEATGCLLELDDYFDETFKFRDDAYNLPVNVKDPDFSEEDDERVVTFEDIKNSFNSLTATLHSGGDISAKIDMESWAKFWLVNDLVRNVETHHPKSCYLFNENPAEGEKWKLGPAWDFDWAFGYEDQRTYFIYGAEEDLFSSAAGQNKAGYQFYNALRKSQAGRKAYKEEWNKFMEEDRLGELMEYIDDYTEFASLSIQHNNDAAVSEKNSTDYEDLAERSKDWLTRRANYIYNSMQSDDTPDQEDITTSTFIRGGIIYRIIDGSVVEVAGPTYDFSSSELSIPESVTFSNVTFSVDAIGASAFEGCAISSVTLPAGLSSIGSNAFKNCTNLSEVRSLSCGIAIGSDCFSNIQENAVLYIPTGTKSAYISNGWGIYFANIQENGAPDRILNNKYFRAGTAQSSMTPNTWYFVHNSRIPNSTAVHFSEPGEEVKAVGGFVRDNGVGKNNAMMSETSVIEAAKSSVGLTEDKCQPCLVRFVPVEGNGDAYKVQFATGNWLQYVYVDPWHEYFVVTDIEEDATEFNFYLIDGNQRGRFGWNVNYMGSRVDNNGAGNTLSPWGSGKLTGVTTGNNVWQIYDVVERREVVIPDGSVDSYAADADQHCDVLSYMRTLSKTNTWNALYVPFEIPMTAEFCQNYDVAYFNDVHCYDKYVGAKEDGVLGQDGVIDGMDMEVLRAQEGSVLNANYPYLIRAKNTDALNMNIKVEDATLYSTKETTISCSSVFMKFDVTGIYNTQTAGELKGEYDVYAISDGGWKQALNANQQLKPFRLYLKLTSIDGSPVKATEGAMSRINIRVQGEDTETGIDELKGENGKVKTDIYDLSGRRVQKAQKGIFIQNGKKVIM